MLEILVSLQGWCVDLAQLQSDGLVLATLDLPLRSSGEDSECGCLQPTSINSVPSLWFKWTPVGSFTYGSSDTEAGSFSYGSSGHRSWLIHLWLK